MDVEEGVLEAEELELLRRHVDCMRGKSGAVRDVDARVRG